MKDEECSVEDCSKCGEPAIMTNGGLKCSNPDCENS